MVHAEHQGVQGLPPRGLPTPSAGEKTEAQKAEGACPGLRSYWAFEPRSGTQSSPTRESQHRTAAGARPPSFWTKSSAGRVQSARRAQRRCPPHRRCFLGPPVWGGRDVRAPEEAVRGGASPPGSGRRWCVSVWGCVSVSVCPCVCTPVCGGEAGGRVCVSVCVCASKYVSVFLCE